MNLLRKFVGEKNSDQGKSLTFSHLKTGGVCCCGSLFTAKREHKSRKSNQRLSPINDHDGGASVWAMSMQYYTLDSTWCYQCFGGNYSKVGEHHKYTRFYRGSRGFAALMRHFSPGQTVFREFQLHSSASVIEWTNEVKGSGKQKASFETMVHMTCVIWKYLSTNTSLEESTKLQAFRSA